MASVRSPWRFHSTRELVRCGQEARAVCCAWHGPCAAGHGQAASAANKGLPEMLHNGAGSSLAPCPKPGAALGVQGCVQNFGAEGQWRIYVRAGTCCFCARVKSCACRLPLCVRGKMFWGMRQKVKHNIGLSLVKNVYMRTEEQMTGGVCHLGKRPWKTCS